MGKCCLLDSCYPEVFKLPILTVVIIRYRLKLLCQLSFLKVVKATIPDMRSCECLFVTVYGKTRHMGFFVKVEFEASMISSTIELTRLQVLDRSCASLWRYSALCVIAPHPQ